MQESGFVRSGVGVGVGVGCEVVGGMSGSGVGGCLPYKFSHVIISSYSCRCFAPRRAY